MADPQQRALAGTPFRPSAGAWNKMLDAARAFEAGAGVPGGVAVPHCLVRVRNDTGADLAAFAVVRLGASVLDVTAMHRVNASPMFEGLTPTGASDAFAILIEPAAEDKWALAAVSGVVPVIVNVSDAGHGYAAPGTTTDELVSAASGPARIIDRETGTGDHEAVVLLGGGPAGGGPEGWATRGKLDGALSFGGSATMSVWYWNGSAEADTGRNVTVYDWLLLTGQSIASGTQVTASWDARSGRYYVTGAQCEA
jgi:hypothetical protein